ncbi:serine-rich adhesin for platelets-like [Linepithema humile]|uniref:serine-rich adhesin for platelets-like n=1 Tax=Linepithema humile TaxID=83485 RepID=UPI00351F08D7
MRITCFITVCAYLSSTVSSNVLKHVNRITRGNLHDELVFEDVTKKGIKFAPPFYPEIFTLQKPLVRNEVFQMPKTIYEYIPRPQQQKFPKLPQLLQQPKQKQQQYHYNRGRSRDETMKRLKTRSIVGASTFELNDNQVISKDLLTNTEVHEEKPIHIEPVLRVTTKKNVLESIVDIVKQLLYPSKNEPGPIVGPIKIPGTGRKIFLRLLEPLDQSHVMVRFVTQLKVPVADLTESKNPEVIPIPPVIDPVSALLNPHSGNAILSDAAFSSSNRNVVRANLGKSRPTQSTEATNALNSVKSSPPQDLPATVAPSSDKPLNEAEANKNGFLNAQPNLGNQFPGSYYHYQSADEALKEVNAILNDTTIVNGAPKPLEPWHQLTTHRLPLRQIAPLYPLTTMEHDASPHANTYKVPSDPLTDTGPNTFPGHEQYNSAPASYASSYEQQYSAPNYYSTSYDKPIDVNPTANTYSAPFPQQNEFNNIPSPYATSYQNQNQNEFSGGPSPYSTSYGKQSDLYGASSSHEAPVAVPPTPGSYAVSYDKQNNDQTGLSASQGALRVIDPPSYLPNQSNQSFEPGRPLRYNFNDVSSSTKQRGETTDPVIWGKTKREKNQSSFENSPDVFSNINDGRKWEPLTFFQENADWQGASKAESELRETKPQPKKSSRNAVSSTERTTDQRLLNGKRRSATATTRSATATTRSATATTRSATTTTHSPRCSNEDGCEQAKPTTAPTLHSTLKVVEKAQEIVNIESIAVKPTESSTAEALRLEATKSPVLSSMASITTEKPALLIMIENPVTELSLPLIRTTKSPLIDSTERLIAHEALNRQAVSKVKAKSTVSSTTESISPNSATKVSNNTTKKLQLPKRPMIMKKPTFIMKRIEENSTKKTTTSSTTQKSTTKRTIRTKYQGAKTKSSTT